MATATPTSLPRAGRIEEPPTESAVHVTRFDRWIAGRIQRGIANAPVRIELWDGSVAPGAPRCAVGDLVVRDRRTLLRLAIEPDWQFGEAYTAGTVRIRGSLHDVVLALTGPPAPTSRRERVIAALLPSNTIAAARRNVHHHYDLGNDFYARWLDREMVYTCAYFEDPEASLDDAQRAKLDLMCRKLRLRPGDSVVEAGCGWGALALHMAREYGATVRAFNVSREQLAFARARARAEGLDRRVEFIEDDYRNVSGRYDAFVSVGMLEHVGRRALPAVADVLRRIVRRNGGRGLLHFIGRDLPRPLNTWIRRRIFPGAYAPTLAEVSDRVLAPAGMSVVDVENLRLHYARTLAHWSRRFSAAQARVGADYGESFLRAWELYLAGSEAAFVTGWLQLFQVVFAPCESEPPFFTRAALYGSRGASQ